MRNDPTRRALRLLALLQTHRLWSAAELAERLEITERTVRRDVDRLRDLGYPVDATSGRDGGYRLAAGAHLPPLVFDDDEAVAVVVGLRAAAGATIAGIEESSVRALAKVEQALPDRLRRRVSALNHSLMSLQRAHRGDDAVDPEALSLLASAACDASATGGRRSTRDTRPLEVAVLRAELARLGGAHRYAAVVRGSSHRRSVRPNHRSWRRACTSRSRASWNAVTMRSMISGRMAATSARS